LLSGVRSLNNGESKWILAKVNKPWCYKAGLPELILQYQFCNYLLPRYKFGRFGTYYYCVNRHYLVIFLITELKQNKRNSKQKGGRYEDTN